MNQNYKSLIFIIALTQGLFSCKKMIEIPAPTNSISTSQVFSTDIQATDAASAMFYSMINSYPSFASGGLTIFCGLSADELTLYDQTQPNFLQFQQNNLFAANELILFNFWNGPYSIIYSANAILEGLTNSTLIHDSVKNELIGEAKFARAFCYFYLVNLFGDIPMPTTVNWHKTNLLSRSSVTDVYNLVIDDLKDAKSFLAVDYSVGHGERIIPNQAAATAMLARVYLYQKKWLEAEIQANNVISSPSFTIEPDLNSVFLLTSKEAIWQLQQSNMGSSSYSATPEGFRIIPFDSATPPYVFLTPQLLSSFESNDKRKENWINQSFSNGIEYHYPYKYKMGKKQADPAIGYSEYYTPLRLAEQYLIRAEARAQQNNLEAATEDLNMIRKRAGLSQLTGLSQTQLLTSIAHERQVEFFAEWGHRWLDLKRTNDATNTLSSIKPNWNVNDQLYPIPQAELRTDPNLTQNPGY